MKRLVSTDKIDVLFSNYIDNPDKFYEIALQGARIDKVQKITLSSEGREIEDEMMDLSYVALERARKFEKFGSSDGRWLKLSYILRKVAQIIFNEFKSESKHERFLRLIK